MAPEPIDQFGVLPYRPREDGELEILLVTSRETGRWVIPKGNPMPRLTSRETAQSEAYEEGGVEGHIGQAPIGHFIYDKTRSSGRVVKAKVSVFPLEVTREHKEWPEKSQRRRQWFDREEAATNVGEPELQALIRRFHPPPGYPDGPGIDMGKLRIGRGFGMVNVIRAIMPREDRFFDMFARHADLVVAGADAMVAMFSGEQPIAESCQQIEAHEDQADDVTRDVLVAVRRSFITPFDRSAITALTSAMDDALDEMWQTAKAITLYEVKDFEPQMLEMSRYAAEGARLIQEAIPLLRSVARNAQKLHALTEAVVHLEGKADRLHEQGLKAIYQQHKTESPMEFFVRREVYVHVERVLDRLEDVADEIQGIVIDHA